MIDALVAFLAGAVAAVGANYWRVRWRRKHPVPLPPGSRVRAGGRAGRSRVADARLPGRGVRASLISSIRDPLKPDDRDDSRERELADDLRGFLGDVGAQHGADDAMIWMRSGEGAAFVPMAWNHAGVPSSAPWGTTQQRALVSWAAEEGVVSFDGGDGANGAPTLAAARVSLESVAALGSRGTDGRRARPLFRRGDPVASRRAEALASASYGAAGATGGAASHEKRSRTTEPAHACAGADRAGFRHGRRARGARAARRGEHARGERRDLRGARGVAPRRTHGHRSARDDALSGSAAARGRSRRAGLAGRQRLSRRHAATLAERERRAGLRRPVRAGRAGASDGHAGDPADAARHADHRRDRDRGAARRGR